MNGFDKVRESVAARLKAAMPKEVYVVTSPGAVDETEIARVCVKSPALLSASLTCFPWTGNAARAAPISASASILSPLREGRAAARTTLRLQSALYPQRGGRRSLGSAGGTHAAGQAQGRQPLQRQARQHRSSGPVGRKLGTVCETPRRGRDGRSCGFSAL